MQTLRSKQTFLTAVTQGIKAGNRFMDDEFIGFKFIGENAWFWNSILADTCPTDLVITKELLSLNGITLEKYKSGEEYHNSLRTGLAGRFMQGLITNNFSPTGFQGGGENELAKIAVECADALIKALKD